MKIDTETFEAAWQKYLSLATIGVIPNKHIIKQVTQVAFDTADLVSLANYEKMREMWIETEAERDEARREAKEFRENLKFAAHHFDRISSDFDKQSKQLAALREALTDIAEAKHDNATLMRKTAEIALADTAKAAATTPDPEDGR